MYNWAEQNGRQIGVAHKHRGIHEWTGLLDFEPGNSGMGVKSQPLMEAVLTWARQAKASQPLTVGAWADFRDPMQRRMMDLSDVVSFHGYDARTGIEAKLKLCGEQGRPVICTEWLLRQGGNTPQTLLPLFRDRKIGCYNWGLVAGRIQTYMPWGSTPGTPVPKLWQHDLFHKDGSPFDPAEVQLIRRVTGVGPLGRRSRADYGVWLQIVADQSKERKAVWHQGAQPGEHRTKGPVEAGTGG